MKSLVVIDVQNAVFQLPLPLFRAEEALENIVLLVSLARVTNIPVIYLQHNRPNSLFERGKGSWEIHSKLTPQSTEVVVQKTEPDAFLRSELDEALKKMNIDEVYFCGFATEGCVDNSVRGAYTRGYKVSVFEDAHSTTDNPILDAATVLKYHNWLMQRFSNLLKTSQGFV